MIKDFLFCKAHKLISMKKYGIERPYQVITLIIFIMMTGNCLTSCTTNDRNQQTEIKPKAVPVNTAKPGSSYSDTLTVQPLTVVFFNPDSIQLQKIKLTFDSNRYASLEHDCYFQMRNARNVIKKYWTQLNIVEVDKCRFIRFVSKEREVVLTDLNESRDICGIYLYDGIKKPVLTDMMNIDTELENYFSH